MFLTALSDVATHERALESGADDFLSKPINRTELLIRVRSLLRITRLQNELRRERARDEGGPRDFSALQLRQHGGRPCPRLG